MLEERVRDIKIKTLDLCEKYGFTKNEISVKVKENARMMDDGDVGYDVIIEVDVIFYGKKLNNFVNWIETQLDIFANNLINKVIVI